MGMQPRPDAGAIVAMLNLKFQAYDCRAPVPNQVRTHPDERSHPATPIAFLGKRRDAWRSFFSSLSEQEQQTLQRGLEDRSQHG